MLAAKGIHQEGDIRACTNEHGKCQFYKVFHHGHWVCGGKCCQNPMPDGIAARMTPAMGISQPAM